MNHKDIPLNQRLYVLEDIDCADLKNIVRDRDSPKHGNQRSEDELPEEEEGMEAAEAPNKLDILDLLKSSSALANFEKKTNKLTLATLLEVLDGVMEMEGRMLIITTNYPERLDKALIRPGRIDLKLRFRRCTRASLVSMYTHYFDVAGLPSEFDADSLPDDKWTPAEVTQVFLNNMHNPPQGLRDLVNRAPPTLFEE